MKLKLLLYTAFIFINSLNVIGQNWDTKVLKVGYTLDLVYVPTIDRLFVAVEDKVLIVNPYTAAIMDSIVIGGSLSNQTEIFKIAVSDDAQYLYFIKRLENKVFRYKIANKTKDLEINIGEPILDIEVMPGRPKTIAVTRREKRDVAIFDNTFQRPKTTMADFDNISNIVFAYNDSTTLYCSRDGHSSNQFVVVKIDNQGASIMSKVLGIISDFDGRFSSSKDGFVYTNYGIKINLTAQKAPIKEGIYGNRGNPQLINHIGSKYFAADPIENKVYCLVQSREVTKITDSTQLAVFNKSTFNLETVYTLPIKFTLDGYYRELIEWGSGKLAITFGNNLIILRQCTSKNTTTPTILEGRKKVGCADSLATLTASGSFSRYIWSNGDTGRVIKVPNNGNFQQFLSVASIDTEGCLSPYSVPSTLTFESNSEQPRIYIPDQRTITCKGDSINLDANNFTNRTTYWSNGAKGNNIWVKQTGDYTMYNVTENGCKSPVSPLQKITVLDFNTPPRPVVKIERGDTLLCEGASITLSAPVGFSLYKWSNGDNERIVTIIPTNSQDISVRVSDNNGCQSPPSVPIYLERLRKPYLIPAINLNNNVLASSVNKGNQWFLNGNVIQGATSQFFKPTQAGSYTVKYAERGCFSDTSNVIQF